jgi:hypothetical protein
MSSRTIMEMFISSYYNKVLVPCLYEKCIAKKDDYKQQKAAEKSERLLVIIKI